MEKRLRSNSPSITHTRAKQHSNKILFGGKGEKKEGGERHKRQILTLSIPPDYHPNPTHWEYSPIHQA